MIKKKLMSLVLVVLGITMISVALILEDNHIFKSKNVKTESSNINVINMSSSNREVEVQIIDNPGISNDTTASIKELSMEQAPQAEYIPPRVEVYEGMTIEELSDKLNRSLGTSYLQGKGNIIATKCIELGVDPYVATAIMLHETGCRYKCSNLVVKCNNVGGQKGSPSCGGGSYKYYASLEDGIVGHIENLYYRYYSRGLNTVETIGPRYAESKTWVSKINWYIDLVRAS